MIKAKVMGLLLTVAMTFSTGASINNINSVNSASSNTDEEFNLGGTVDLAIANDEKIIEMLKKKGTISKDATPDQAEKALQNYLKSLENSNKKNPQKLDTKELQALKNYGKEAVKKGKLKNDDKKSNVKDSGPQSTWDGSVTKDKALVLLIEFPDLLHNTLTKEETDMYYTDYNANHFSDMIFGNNGYTGPNGEKFVSLKQFYDEQSGGSYDIEGQVLGWYKAKENAEYYGADSADGSNHNVKVRDLVKEALISASKDADLGDFDLKDPYDLDGDNDINEPDGIIDHLMIIHSGMGQEAGGGSIGDDSIWSHSSLVYTANNGYAYPYKIPDTDISAYPYTIMPEDGAAGVFAHEFGHDLGLPDEYDTIYSGAGEPIGYWSIMSSGSWGGKIPGTEPTGFSPYAKEFFQKTYGGNWQHGSTIDLKDINSKGNSYILDSASIKDKNNDVIKITLPKKETITVKPYSGTYSYFSGKGDNLDNSMTTNLDLTSATTAELSFKANYDIELDWDYASIQVKLEGENTWVSIPGNITTDTNPNEQNPGYGITGVSNGWIDAKFDLSKYAGKKIDLKINYWTDVAATMPGLYVDDININVNGNIILFDDAEGSTKFIMDGFSTSEGKVFTDQYYYLEWRSHIGVDEGLAHIKRGLSLMSHNPGLLVWYGDDFYSDNWTGVHPGEGYLGIVDADKDALKWSDKAVGSTKYQMHDAAFSLEKGEPMFLDYGTTSMTDNHNIINSVFNDSHKYITKEIPDAGRNVPNYGLQISVIQQAKNNSSATITIKK